ncbi:hypothetical protein QJS10_CPB19g00427 [Acorus calamus]|uniref:Uncharacterized protein n=1 Tax=Acorus calamus TaxID=4465 RepID=A0AAV9CHB5_ACOCL|nr:hypothetical protein QJS10_CPB19g00427 [Acorus calamus]
MMQFTIAKESRVSPQNDQKLILVKQVHDVRSDEAEEMPSIEFPKIHERRKKVKQEAINSPLISSGENMESYSCTNDESGVELQVPNLIPGLSEGDNDMNLQENFCITDVVLELQKYQVQNA